jgi:predicted Zn-dependent protease
MRASELAPDLPAPAPLRAAILVETGRVEEAYALVGDALQRFPDAPDVRYAGVYALTYAGFTEDARRQLERVLTLDPGYLTAGGWTPNVLLYERQWDQFLAQLPARDTPLFRFYRGYALYHSGRRAEARAQLAPSFRQHPNDVFSRLCRALIAVIDGRSAEAVTEIRHLARQRLELDGRDGEMTYKQAQLLALAGDREASAAELERAVQQGFVCARCIEQDPALAAIHDTPRFQRALAAARARHTAFATRFALTAR